MSTFEDRLWSQLVDEHGDRMRLPDPATRVTQTHKRRPALITGTALATAGAAVAAVIAFSAGTSAPPAYAVTTDADGTVTVTLNDISAVTGLNAELTRDGIDTTAIPLTTSCTVHEPLVTMPSGTDPSTYTITIDPRQIPAGYTGVLAAGTDTSGQVVLMMGAVKPPLPSCFNSTAMQLHYLDVAHASPAQKAAIARARRAAQAAAKR